MNTFKQITLSFFALFLVFAACTSDGGEDDKKITADQLSGKWSLTSAERNGQETGSLEGTFMHFAGDKLTCNFTGEEVDQAFTFENDEIKHGDQVYKIVQFTPSELVATTKLMTYDFKLTFTKAE